MILDLSHASEMTARMALRYIADRRLKLPVMASHVGSYDVYPHKRNLSDDLLRQIVDLDGFVGIYTLTFCLDAEDNSPKPFLRHLAHVLRFAPHHVGIGSDSSYYCRPLADWQREFGAMKGLIDPHNVYGARFPDTPVELNGYDRMSRIQMLLEQADFTQLEQANILGVNFLSFLERSLR